MKPSYIPGHNINLQVAHWYGISCMLEGTDTALGQYIADEIANEPPLQWHVIYGLSYEECRTIEMQVRTAYDEFRKALCKKSVGYILSAEEEQSRAEDEVVS